MTLLTLVQDHCRVHALNVPTTVVGSQDTSTKQIWGLVNSLIEDIVDESKWQAFAVEKTFTLIAAEDQGTIDSILGANNGFLWFYPDTFYDRTLRRPLYGPVTAEEWQQLKALPNPGPWYKFRIRGDHLLINPAPTVAGGLSSIAVEYASSFGVKDAGGTRKAQFTLDDDVSVLPERILKKGLAFRWKQLKNLPYQADETRYFDMLNNYIARDGTKRSYNLGENRPLSLRPGVFVPSGNWPVS